MTLLVRRSLFYHIHNRLEGEGFVGREFRQHLAIELDVGLLQGRDEGRIPPVILPARGLQAHDPQLAPFAFLAPPIAVRVLPRLLHPADGNRKAVLGASAVALGMLQEILMLEKVEGDKCE